MAKHGENYTRAMGPNGEEIGKLGPDCGHHCGVITVGHSDTHVGHCPCPECHGDERVSELPINLVSPEQGAGISPGTIH